MFTSLVHPFMWCIQTPCKSNYGILLVYFILLMVLFFKNKILFIFIFTEVSHFYDMILGKYVNL